MKRRNIFLTFGVLFVMLGLTLILAIAIGAVAIPPGVTLQVLLSRIGLGDISGVSGSTVDIIWRLRLPRVILGMLVGASLSLAGATFQGLLRNPLADPFTIGVSSGAAVGATIAILLRQLGVMFFPHMLPAFAFVGAFLAMFFIYNLAKIGGQVPVVTLLLAGVVVSSFLSAIISLIMVFSGQNMQGIFFWLSGGLMMRSWTEVWFVLPYLLVGFLVLFFYARELNILLMGEEAALHLGVRVEFTKKLLLVIASLVTAAAVSVSGMIGFVGLIVPHAVRIVSGPDHRVLLPASALVGAIFLVWADVFARTAVAPQEIPVGIITAFVGAPFFIYLLRKKKKDIRL
ncbi:FecCD family ABC transporter permease [Dethiobacter alkaliphilus]|uniref:FecCD family ABC transporter permease n=1 Tax=Dethiobacter alkaliphilus TaxID=427926 RepID=UPI002227F6C9|nr:iron chelate uptake ABC transporter family permease subunit [Dethiobacter alkaliphilus]MCW3491469.1 iron chelate uptake ABC transporter family permease subunit [Dethiobacter alkaliphilus]